MNNAQRFKILNNTSRTVFSSQDIQALWNISSHNTKIILKRMLQNDLLIKLAKGYYALSVDFNIYELANLIISPSYISLDSALLYHGVSFQTNSRVISAALLNYKRQIKNTIFEYHAMKESLFFNLAGINYNQNFSMAVPERAILDTFYFGFLPNLDNFEKINRSYLKELAQFYPKTIQKKVTDLIK